MSDAPTNKRNYTFDESKIRKIDHPFYECPSAARQRFRLEGAELTDAERTEHEIAQMADYWRRYGRTRNKYLQWHEYAVRWRQANTEPWQFIVDAAHAHASAYGHFSIDTVVELMKISGVRITPVWLDDDASHDRPAICKTICPLLSRWLTQEYPALVGKVVQKPSKFDLIEAEELRFPNCSEDNE